MTGNAADFLIEANKFAWLTGEVSTVSDEDGIAKFTNLSVLGSTADNFYIFFTCDALHTIFFGTQLTKAEAMFDLPKFQPPIFLEKTVYSLNFKTMPSKQVVEGENFQIPAVVRVLDAAGKPL